MPLGNLSDKELKRIWRTIDHKAKVFKDEQFKSGQLYGEVTQNGKSQVWQVDNVVDFPICYCERCARGCELHNGDVTCYCDSCQVEYDMDYEILYDEYKERVDEMIESDGDIDWE